MGSDWAGLPRDLVDLMLERFVSVSDYLRFGLVCKAWHSASTENINNLLPPQVPILIVPSDVQRIWNVYSIKDNKLLPLQFPIPYIDESDYFVGSSNGWLTTVDKDFVVRLLNPLCLVPGEHISLNGCITLPTLHINKGYHIQKVILTSNPTSSPDEYMVMVLFKYVPYSAFIRPSRGKEWTYVHQGEVYFDDAIYYQDHFHAIDWRGNVFSFDVTDKSCLKYMPLNHNTIPKLRAFLMKHHLVESNTGELLLVERIRERHEEWEYHYTIGAKKLCKTCKGWEWIEMKSIGDSALFIGNNYLSVVPSDFSGCQPNSIYFTDGYSNYLSSTGRPRDLGVYNMGSRSFTPFYMTDDVRLVENSRWFPIWIVPSF